jgi:hypothetical protein
MTQGPGPLVTLWAINLQCSTQEEGRGWRRRGEGGEMEERGEKKMEEGRGWRMRRRNRRKRRRRRRRREEEEEER